MDIYGYINQLIFCHILRTKCVCYFKEKHMLCTATNVDRSWKWKIKIERIDENIIAVFDANFTTRSLSPCLCRKAQETEICTNMFVFAFSRVWKMQYVTSTDFAKRGMQQVTNIIEKNKKLFDRRSRREKKTKASKIP